MEVLDPQLTADFQNCLIEGRHCEPQLTVGKVVITSLSSAPGLDHQSVPTGGSFRDAKTFFGQDAMKPSLDWLHPICMIDIGDRQLGDLPADACRFRVLGKSGHWDQLSHCGQLSLAHVSLSDGDRRFGFLKQRVAATRAGAHRCKKKSHRCRQASAVPAR
jgi:hypothetical protein